MTNRLKMFREARSLGFEGGKRTRQVVKGKVKEDAQSFHCTRGNRKLTLEIYLNGRGCCYHSIANTSWGQPVTHIANAAMPTEFKDLAGMYRAIAFEWQRPTTEAKIEAPKPSREEIESKIVTHSPDAVSADGHATSEKPTPKPW